MKSVACVVSRCVGVFSGVAAAVITVAALILPLSGGSVYARVTETCLTGTAPDVTNDPSQIRAVRSMVDAGCVCSSFDGTTGKTHKDYVKCAAGIIAAQVPAAPLRPQCKRTVKKYYANAICGRNPNQHTEPCITTALKTGKITCAIKPSTKKDGVTPTNACSSTTKATRVACPAYTQCLEAADTNNDLIIAAAGDTGMCVPTPTATEPPTATPTQTPPNTPTATNTPPPVCGDGIVEGTEECDDGNLIPYDGCSQTCTIEPHCLGGTCTAVCGDGIVEETEECDDGNTAAGDGCSPTCTVEPGWTCNAVDQPSASVATLSIPILYRDMLYAGTTVPGPGHPDFNVYGCGVTTGLVSQTLGADGEPVFGPNGTSCMTSAADFCWWYHQTGCSGAGSVNPFDQLVYLNQAGQPMTLTLTELSSNVYQFASTQFYPIDGLGWNAGPNPQTDNDCSGTTGHNFSFTSEVHYPFTYRASAAPTFTFVGDDDVWGFINGHLAVDLGGVHGAVTGSVTLNTSTAATLGLVDGGTYSIDLFQAERHTCGSDYTLSLSDFVHSISTCSPN